MLKKIIAIVISASLISPAQAKLPDSIVETILPSGLRIVTQENPGSKTVSVNVFIAAGSLDETSETSGLAHFYEHMFFRGTPFLTGLEFKKAIEDNGGLTNATTAKDMTHYFISFPAEEAERGLELLASALSLAELDQAGIDIERDVVLEEYRIGENNPGRIAIDGLYRLAYGEHPYAKSTIGTKERIKSFNRVDFLNWKESQYIPSRCTVVVTGDIDAQKVSQKAKVLFASFKGNAAPRVVAEPPTIPEQAIYKEEVGPIGSTLMMLGYPAPSAQQQEDVVAMDVLCFILGQGPYSKLSRQLVKEQEIANSVDATYQTPRQRGLLVISAVCENKVAETVKAQIIEQVAQMGAGNFSDQEMERARTQLLQAHRQSTESNSGKASNIGYYSALGVPDFWKTYPERIKQVQREDIVAVAKKYLSGGHWGFILKPNKGVR